MAKKSKAEKKAEKAAEQARLEAERLEAERVEAERLEAERIERERQERIRKELERVRKTKEAETLAETYHSALPPAGVLVEIHRIYNGDSLVSSEAASAIKSRKYQRLTPPTRLLIHLKVVRAQPEHPQELQMAPSWVARRVARAAGGRDDALPCFPHP